MADAKTFRVERTYVEMVPTMRTDVILETDDPVEANVAVDDWCRKNPGEKYRLPNIRGVHPTHDWTDGRCVNCAACQDGSFKSQMPCGHEFVGPFVAEMDAWRAQRAEA
jgi:hypothetical protein